MCVAQEKEAEFKTIEGLVEIAAFSTPESAAVACASYTSMELLEAAAPKVSEILKELASHFTGPPAMVAGTLVWSHPAQPA